MTLQGLLNSAEYSDMWEEECEEYLEKKGIPLPSHSRRNIYLLAWKNGWRPLFPNEH